MAPYAAEFPGLIETRDGFAIRIEHALLCVVNGTALRITYEGPNLTIIKWRGPDRHQAARRATKLLVLTGADRCIPAAQSIFEDRVGDAETLGKLLSGIKSFEDSQLDLCKIVLTPLENRCTIVVVNGMCQRIKLAAVFIDDEPSRNVRKTLR